MRLVRHAHHLDGVPPRTQQPRRVLGRLRDAVASLSLRQALEAADHNEELRRRLCRVPRAPTQLLDEVRSEDWSACNTPHHMHMRSSEGQDHEGGARRVFNWLVEGAH